MKMRWIGPVYLICLIVLGCSHANVKRSYNLYALGNDSFRRGEFIQALNYYTKAQETTPKDPDISHMLGLTYFARYESEGNPDYLTTSAKYIVEAIKLYDGFQPPDGMEFDRMTLSEARVNLSSVYIQMGRYDEAIEQAQLAAQDSLYRSPDKANFNLGWAYYKKRQPLKAISFLEISVRQNRRFAGGYKTLGEVYLDQKKYKQAIENLRLATEIYPQYAEAYYLLGTAYQKQNQRDSARVYFKKCKEKDPKGKTGLKCGQLIR